MEVFQEFNQNYDVERIVGGPAKLEQNNESVAFLEHCSAASSSWTRVRPGLSDPGERPREDCVPCRSGGASPLGGALVAPCSCASLSVAGAHARLAFRMV